MPIVVDFERGKVKYIEKEPQFLHQAILIDFDLIYPKDIHLSVVDYLEDHHYAEAESFLELYEQRHEHYDRWVCQVCWKKDCSHIWTIDGEEVYFLINEDGSFVWQTDPRKRTVIETDRSYCSETINAIKRACLARQLQCPPLEECPAHEDSLFFCPFEKDSHRSCCEHLRIRKDGQVQVLIHQGLGSYCWEAHPQEWKIQKAVSSDEAFSQENREAIGKAYAQIGQECPPLLAKEDSEYDEDSFRCDVCHGECQLCKHFSSSCWSCLPDNYPAITRFNDDRGCLRCLLEGNLCVADLNLSSWYCSYEPELHYAYYHMIEYAHWEYRVGRVEKPKLYLPINELYAGEYGGDEIDQYVFDIYHNEITRLTREDEIKEIKLENERLKMFYAAALNFVPEEKKKELGSLLDALETSRQP